MNPLFPGFNPDPSVVLVDGTYYLGLFATDGTVTFAGFRYRGDDTEESSA